MTDSADSDPTGTITFFPGGLLHKFGFSDGDLLFDLVEEHHLAVYHHDLLAAVVERLLVPLLNQKVETYVIEATLHNPIRARTIDGEDASMGDLLTPEAIDIPVADILEIARTLPPDEDLETWGQV
ncbi:MAG: hypothetical protein MUP76_04965 [Acidimicrobiia bacterium]|nr:hypothetical protein [Acidimicrobiia bacterium]